MRDLASTLPLFRCPETGHPVTLLGTERLEQLNAAIDEDKARTVDDEPVDRPLDAALQPDDADFVYPVRDGIPDFMPDARIAL